MKKLIVLMSVILLMGFHFTYAQESETEGAPCEYKTFSFTVGAGGRSFSETLFKDVYGGTCIIYSVDFSMKVWETLEAFLHTDYLSKTGELTFTQEETTFKLIPIELGARYLVPTKKTCDAKLFLYIGAGAGYYLIKEENPIGTVDEKRIGFFGEGGVRFYLMSSLFIDAKLKYTILKSENDTNLGGLSYMGGIGISF